MTTEPLPANTLFQAMARRLRRREVKLRSRTGLMRKKFYDQLTSLRMVEFGVSILRRFALPALVLASFGSPVQAQDLEALNDARSVYDWSALYIGNEFAEDLASQSPEDNAGLDGEVSLNGGFFGPDSEFAKAMERCASRLRPNTPRHNA